MSRTEFSEYVKGLKNISIPIDMTMLSREIDMDNFDADRQTQEPILPIRAVPVTITLDWIGDVAQYGSDVWLEITEDMIDKTIYYVEDGNYRVVAAKLSGQNDVLADISPKHGHKYYVKKALREGKPVPIEVLEANYTELVKLVPPVKLTPDGIANSGDYSDEILFVIDNTRVINGRELARETAQLYMDKGEEIPGVLKLTTRSSLAYVWGQDVAVLLGRVDDPYVIQKVRLIEEDAATSAVEEKEYPIEIIFVPQKGAMYEQLAFSFDI